MLQEIPPTTESLQPRVVGEAATLVRRSRREVRQLVTAGICHQAPGERPGHALARTHLSSESDTCPKAQLRRAPRPVSGLGLGFFPGERSRVTLMPLGPCPLCRQSFLGRESLPQEEREAGSQDPGHSLGLRLSLCRMGAVCGGIEGPA